MVKRLVPSSIAALLMAGCSSLSCGADQHKLAQLRLGMSYSDTYAVMGCPGKLVGESDAAADRFTTIEWGGPDSLLFSRTYVLFRNDSLLSYTTNKRGGF